ncbi:ribonuclease P protein component [Methyloferula stellata]|uniref:ribonuclease P protein component n=1 Tax=Methyloferula stellata TaxID=876270 RepID=UPI00035F32B3|nr:ribonuclease P protein component [Methyloferula stellata]
MRELPEAIDRQIPQKPLPAPRLKRRADFLRAAKGERFHARAFTLQATALTEAAEPAQIAAPARFGITVTKRIGGAVQRNRIKRRLKEALRLSPDLSACPGRDYVIVAKAEALTTDFQALQADLANAIRKIQRLARQRPSTGKPARRKASPGRS